MADLQNLRPLAAPGVAVFPQLMAQQPTTLIVKAEHFSRSYNVCHFDGTPLLIIDSESFSASHGKNVIDAQTGQRLCTIRKKT